jgi:hypothetical protein
VHPGFLQLTKPMPVCLLQPDTAGIAFRGTMYACVADMRVRVRRGLYSAVAIVLFAEVYGRNTDLHNTMFIDTSNAYVFENLIIDFALLRALNYNCFAAGK